MRRTTTHRLFCAIVWLAIALTAVKAYYLGVPEAITLAAAADYVRTLTAISYVDLLFVGGVWLLARAALALAATRPLASGAVLFVVVAFSAFCCLYAVASLVIFWIFGGFLTYPLLTLIGDVRMVRSSISAYLTPAVAAGLVGIPLAYIVLAYLTAQRVAPIRGRSWPARAIAAAAVALWVVVGHFAYTEDWTTRSDRRVAANPHWVLARSWWQAVAGDGAVRMDERLVAGDLADFEPSTNRPGASTVVLRRTSLESSRLARARRRPPNVVFLVLESVASRWTSLGGSAYNSTPRLAAESAAALVFDNFYAHIGRSSNSLVAMLMSTYPKLGFRDLTLEYPHLEGISLAQVFRDSGYRTAFLTPSDLSWAGWSTFLEGRGFGEVRDYHNLSCSEPLSSWGVEDRCMLEGVVDFVGQDSKRPFFVMGWTTQTHHPYEPTPGVPLLTFQREPIPDEYDLERYLNVLHETDRNIGRLLDALRGAHLADDTLVVVTGDHGQAFGYPHATYMQGRAVYEEDVHVPLMFWSPRLYRSGVRSKTIGSHVDLGPTILELAGLAPPAQWEGRSLLDPTHPPRAYFYVAEDSFTLGVRENNWKYSLDLREGIEELYDLDRDPSERHNVAADEPARCARLRQRLAAWTEANRRTYERQPLQP